jgi:hypothetical protein
MVYELLILTVQSSALFCYVYMVYYRLDDVAVTRLDAICDVPAWRRGTQPITSLPATPPGTSTLY